MATVSLRSNRPLNGFSNPDAHSCRPPGWEASAQYQSTRPRTANLKE